MKHAPTLLALATLCSVARVSAQAPANTTPPAPAAQQAAPVAPLPPQPPDVAAPKMDPKTGEPQAGFMGAHAKFVGIAKENAAKLLFLGDSITAGWGGHKAIWEAAFGQYAPANFGIGGDRTQHVLWRITNGELDGFTPKALVLMIGTNNSGSDSPEGIASGITKIVETIRQKSPATKILLLAVFPRGDKTAQAAVREKLKTVNEHIAKLDDGKNVFFQDIGAKFLEADGTLTREVMPDLLHLSSKGYQIWADAISPSLAKLMQ
jgi:lysophospholipase L1-like esterase